MPELQDWLHAATDLDAIYQSELGRSVFSDPEGFVNWAYHRLDRGASLEDQSDPANLTDLSATGGGEDDWRKTRANLDPVGQFACFTGNMGTDRMDAFLVEL